MELDHDHPGFSDEAYRRRRDAIARLADDAAPLPTAPPWIEYDAIEHAVWRSARATLSALAPRLVAEELLALSREFPLPCDEVPQLASVSDALAERTGFRLQAVRGLVPPMRFFAALGQGVFLATQYMRHHSRPLYTPEPDIIHELVGHAFTLADPTLAALNVQIGTAFSRADRSQRRALERIYWFSLEFGLVGRGSNVRAVGAGLLSSAGELSRLESQTAVRPWDVEVVATTDYDPSHYQPVLFAAPSVAVMLDDVRAWIAAQGLGVE